MSEELDCRGHNGGETCWLDSNGGDPGVFQGSLGEIARCIRCNRFREALSRSTGRRRSDVFITSAVSRFLDVMTAYNDELSTMAENLNKNVEELTVRKTVSEALLRSTDLKSCMRIVLTGATAGQAIGLNRAALFLVNQSRRTLDGQLAVGHLDVANYQNDWKHIADTSLTFEDLVKYSERPDTPSESQLTSAVQKIHIPLRREFGVLPQAVIDKRSFTTVGLDEISMPDRTMREIFGVGPCAVVPIVSKLHSLGAIIVDNPVTRSEISQEKLSLLETLSYLAAAKIDNVILQSQLEIRIAELEHLHKVLKDNQKYLVDTERLVEAGRLVSTVAHEVKTPLVTIGGYARRARRRYETGDDISRDLSIIVDEITRLERITKDFLDYSRKRKLKIERFDLNDLINESFEVLAGKTIHDDIEVSRDLKDAPLQVNGDKSWLKQVVYNLLDNATQSIDGHGIIKAATGSDSGYHWFEITDNGCGIPEETLDMLFLPCYTTKSRGSGLGLPVSNRIVADHGGFIDVQSQLGNGSTFRVYLPKADKTEQE